MKPSNKLMIVLIIQIGCLFSNLIAQHIQWEHYFSEWHWRYGQAVVTDAQNNVYVTGSDGTIKYSPEGDTLWTHPNAWMRDIAIDHSGHIVLAGADSSIWKLNPDGSVFWERRYDLSVESIAIDARDNLAVVIQNHSGSGSYLTVKIDSSGEIAWSRVYDSLYTDEPNSVAFDPWGNVIVTGFTDVGQGSIIDWDWYTIKYSSEGEFLWSRRYHQTLSDFAYAVTTDTQGNIIVVGGTDTAEVVKYSPNGNMIWHKKYSINDPSRGIGYFSDVLVDQDDNIYLAGRSDHFSPHYYSFITVKCLPNGDTLWTALSDTLGGEEANGITRDSNGDVIVTGANTDNDRGYFTVKINDLTYTSINTTREEIPCEFQISTYPNPFNPTTTIRFTIPENSPAYVTIFDQLGREVKTLVKDHLQTGDHETLWDASNNSGQQIGSGIYFVRVSAGGFSETVKLVYLK